MVPEHWCVMPGLQIWYVCCQQCLFLSQCIKAGDWGCATFTHGPDGGFHLVIWQVKARQIVEEIKKEHLIYWWVFHSQKFGKALLFWIHVVAMHHLHPNLGPCQSPFLSHQIRDHPVLTVWAWPAFKHRCNLPSASRAAMLFRIVMSSGSSPSICAR